jgi:hypothetical protein
MFLLAFVYPPILILSIIAIIRNWKKSIRNKFQNNDESSVWIILSGVLFTTLAPMTGFLRFDAFGPDIPFAKPEVLVIEVLVVVSAICYWVSKIFKKNLSPFVNLLLRAGLLQGVILDFIVTIHFANYFGLGLIFPIFGFELLAPPMALIFLLYEFQCNLKSTAKEGEPAFSIQKNMLFQFGVVVALIVVEQTMLLPAGFHWNSLISAFTESRGFIFSHASRFNF